VRCDLEQYRGILFRERTLLILEQFCVVTANQCVGTRRVPPYTEERIVRRGGINDVGTGSIEFRNETALANE